MANMTFGVNIIPHNNVPDGNNTYSLGNSNNKWNIYVNQVNGTNLTIPSGETIATTDQVDACKIEIVRLTSSS